MSNVSDAINNSLSDFKLDLLGVINLFGGDIAVSAIHYCVLERRRIFWSAYLSPGSFTVATKLLKRTDNTLANSLSPGHREEYREIVGLLETGKYFYVGLLSGTRTRVANAISEAALNTVEKKTDKIILPVTEKNETARVIKVDVLDVELNPEERDGKPVVSYEMLPRWYDIIFPIITLGVFGLVVWLGDIIGALIVIIGALSNLLLTYAACASGCRYMEGSPSSASPDGNAVVKNELSPNQLWVVLGKEDAMQRFLQRPIIVHLDKYWSIVNSLVGLFVYVYTAFSIVALPLVRTPVQVMLGGLYFIGVFANITYARRDGDALLLKIAEKDMKLKYKESLKFPNRASAVAFCVLRCRNSKSNSSNLKLNLDDLLPTNTPVWTQYGLLLTHMAKPEQLRLDYEKTIESLNQWQDRPDVNDIKEDGLWKRLIDDLLLAKKAYLDNQ